MLTARARSSRDSTAAVRAGGAHDAGEATRTPLELVDQACDDIARHVQPSGRGRYAFPFNTVQITFVAPTSEARARFDAICAGPPSIEERVLPAPESAGCVSRRCRRERLRLQPRPIRRGRDTDFHVALARVDRSRAPLAARPVRIDLLVTHGTADRGAYSFTSLPIAIGRGAEVRDNRQQLLRINHVAFTEASGDVNQSVSRRHARIELDQSTQRPRLVDDNSAQGTSVIRHGRGIAVPRGSRGLGLQSEDEIVLGQARVRVRLITGSKDPGLQ